MNAWILVMFFSFNGRIDAVSVPGFTSRPACQQAGIQLEKTLSGRPSHKPLDVFGVTMTCIRTGR